jgi:probable addiction module antidote protein
MPKRTASYEDDLMQQLRDPEYALHYLQVALEDDGDEHSDVTFLLALRKVAQANQMTQVADAAGLSRESLYKMLSEKGNPGFGSLRAVLKAIGLDLTIKPLPPSDVIAADTFTQEVERADEWLAQISDDTESFGFSARLVRRSVVAEFAATDSEFAYAA